MSTIRSEHRCARKEHRCSNCYGAIKKGSIYHYHVVNWEGEIEVWKSCERCEPTEDGNNGGWVRPEDVWANPGEWPAQYTDGAVMIESYYEYEGWSHTDYKQNESVMVPLMGMMEWAEVLP